VAYGLARLEKRLRNRLALAVTLTLFTSCKSKKTEPAASSGSITAVAADASFDSGSPAGNPSLRTEGAAGSAAAPVAPAAAMPSESLVAGVPRGPMRTADNRVVWCTRGDNGMAEWAEVNCHIAAPGKKTVVVPIMTYADAMAVDEGVDPAGDADAGVKAASARDRVAAGLARLAAEAGTDLTPMPAPFGCKFESGAFAGRIDDPLGNHDGCTRDGITPYISAPGKVTFAQADNILFTEVFKARARGKGDGGDACHLEATIAEASADVTAGVAALAIWLTNPSDTCALVTEFEVRAVKL
jgi:hypothetical protein